MDKVTYIEDGVTYLENFNLYISEGEILGFLPITLHGLQSFLNLVKTNLPLYDGTIYYKENKINSWREQRRTSNRMTVIQSETSLVEGMTVVDNIFVLRQGFRKHLIQEEVLLKQLFPFLQEINLHINGEMMVEKLSVFQRIIVELLKGIVAGHKLIVLNEMSTLIGGEELDKLQEIMRYYAEKGYAFIYITPHLEEVLQFCDRIALMSNGSINKVLKKYEMDEESISTLTEEYDKMIKGYLGHHKERELSKEVCLSFRAELPILKNDLSFEAKKGECLVIQCLDNRLYLNLLSILLEENHRISWELFLNGKRERIYKNRNFAVIKEECTKSMIFSHLSYVDNLCFTLDHRMKYVWLKRKIKKSLEKEFEGVFGEAVFDLNVEVLTEKEKYQLVYTRILLQKPKVVFLVQPFKGADMNHRMLIWELIGSFLEKGITVIILSLNFADTLSIADRLLRLESNGEQTEYEKKNFSKIPVLAPWLRMYKEKEF